MEIMEPEVTITAKIPKPKPKQTTKKKMLLDRLDSRVEMTEGRSEELEQWSREFARVEQQRKQTEKEKKEQRLRDLQDTSKRSNDCIITERE